MIHSTEDLIQRIKSADDIQKFKQLHWKGSFADYLKIFRDTPMVARSAYQRVYDMILSHGKDEYRDHKKKILRYPFFNDPYENGKDAVFGLDIHLMKLVCF